MRARAGNKSTFRARGNLRLTLLGFLSVSLPPSCVGVKPTTPSLGHSPVGKSSSWLRTLKSFDLLEEVHALEASGIRHEGDLAYLAWQSLLTKVSRMRWR